MGLLNKIMLNVSHKKVSLEKDSWKREVKSLCWKGDDLVDHIGLNIFSLNGELSFGKISWGSLLDSSISLFDGNYTVLFQRYGTKGLVLKDDELIREISRSYYCAEAYEFPVAIFTYNNKICLAHCPEEYNILEIEDFVTGERLTAKGRESHDFFHSRLEVSPNGKYLLSAGWVWHPVDMIEIYDLTDISNPQWFNLYHNETLNLFEINSATFLNDKVVVITGNEEEESQKFIYSYDVEKEEVLTKAKLSEVAGNLMAIDENFVLGFFEHPKLINISSGKIEEKWTEIESGKQNSSIKGQEEKFPIIAKDLANNRVAIANKDFIHILEFHTN